jgi:hypothetical protein
MTESYNLFKVGDKVVLSERASKNARKSFSGYEFSVVTSTTASHIVCSKHSRTGFDSCNFKFYVEPTSKFEIFYEEEI